MKGEFMKKVITFTEEQVMQIQYMLNAVTITGIQNAKQIAAIAQMLELGTPGEIKEPEEPPVDTLKACTAQNNARPAKGRG
jgi:predicted RNase H-like nuclease